MWLRSRTMSWLVIVWIRACVMSQATGSSANSPAKRITGIKMQHGLTRHMGRSRYGRSDFTFTAVEPPVFSDEGAADEAFLNPDVALCKTTVGCEAGKFGACTGAAGRAVIGFAGAENEVAAVHTGLLGACKEL